MSSKGSFENPYEDYSGGATNVLHDSKKKVSDKFKAEMIKFEEEYLHILQTKMEKDIFCDGTVYTGSAGLALYYLKKDQNEMALSYINLDALKKRRISFLCGDAGPLAIATVISYRLNAALPEGLPDYKTLAESLISLVNLLHTSPDEILYGKAGYLYALLFVNKFTAKEIIPASHIEKVINAIIDRGKQFSAQMKVESPLLWQWHDKIYFGAAHGMAGILYMLLQARKYIGAVVQRNLIRPAIDWLLNHRYPSGNFYSSLGSSSGDRLVQWCHGAPGFVPLCLLAFQVFEDPTYYKVAVECGEIVWQRGLCSKGYSLCHGVAGNAYTFLQLYQVTKLKTSYDLMDEDSVPKPSRHTILNNDLSDSTSRVSKLQLEEFSRYLSVKVCLLGGWFNAADTLPWLRNHKKPRHLYRACCFAEWCVSARPGTERHSPDRPASLFEGLAGRLYLAHDMLAPIDARFPAMCL